MTERIHAPHVGAPDPELKNSPIVEDTEDEFESAMQGMGESAVCHFNDAPYEDKSYVCSGDELLRCQRGVWLRAGTCDPDHSA
jgi:hypothetical protein